jgi:hypothetical protein
VGKGERSGDPDVVAKRMETAKNNKQALLDAIEAKRQAAERVDAEDKHERQQAAARRQAEIAARNQAREQSS